MIIHVIESMGLTQDQKKRLSGLGSVKWFEGLPSVEETVERSKGADILAVDWAPIDGAIPKMGKGVKLVSLPYTGVGFIPIKEAAEKGIKIANAPGYSTESVGEFGIGLMISAVRKIHHFAGNLHPKSEVELCLSGRSLLVLGHGRIGSYVGAIATALGMNVTYWKRGSHLLTMLKTADVLFCALPFSDKTKGLLGSKEFKAMKQGSFFITTAHNQIYDHNALLEALKSNLAGAAMDLEGINNGEYDSPIYKRFMNHPKILITPHIAYKTDLAIKNGYDMMIDNIENFIKGKPTNLAN